MDQLLEKIILAIRDYWPTVTGKFKGNYFDFETNIEESTVGVITSGAGAFDIGGIIGPGTPVTTAKFTEQCAVMELEIPVDALTGTQYATHWNRYSLYSSLDVGDDGVNPLTRDKNNPELFIHNADIPVAKALIAKCSSASGDGYSGTLTVGAQTKCGELVPGDKGCTVRFQNGSEVVLVKYLTSKTFGISTSTTITEQACAIGGDNAAGKPIRVTTVDVFAGTVTRKSTAGTPFSVSDSGKILFLSNGLEVTLKSFIDVDNFSVVEIDAIAMNVAACLDPKTRRWTDTVRDDPYKDLPNLRSRITLQSLQQRFFQPLPDCDRGDVSGSMIWASVSGESVVRYSQAKSGWRHLGGYYYESEQTEEADDNIEDISIIGSIVTIKCRRKTFKISINQFENIVLRNEGTIITKCSGISILDGAIGIRDFGGVCDIPGMDRQVVITGEPGIRILSESGYGENLATNRIQKYLDRMIAEYSTKYDPVNGFTFWGWLKKLL